MRLIKRVVLILGVLCFCFKGDVYASDTLAFNSKVEIFEETYEKNKETTQEKELNNLSNEIDITESDFSESDAGFSNFASAASTGIDLKIDNFTISGSGPLVPYERYDYTVSISNIGNISAINVKMSIVHNSEVIDTVNIGTVPGNSSGTLHFTYGGLIHGENTIGIILDPSNEIQDINRNNNSIYKTFNAIGHIDLVATEVKAIQISETTYPTEFRFSVANNGTAPAGTFHVKIMINDEQVGVATVDGLQPFYKYTAKLSLIFYRSGSYSVSILADPYDIIVESNKNNNAVSSSFTIPQNTDLWYGKQINAKHITVNISAEAENLYQKSTLSSYTSWNNRTSNVNLYAPTYSGDNDLTYSTINVFAEEMDGTTLAYCQVYNEDRRITDYFNDPSTYTRAQIFLDSRSNQGLLTYSDENRRIKTIRHEFGHALGLAHPECMDTAIMHQGYGQEYNSVDITTHDIHNLRFKYDN